MEEVPTIGEPSVEAEEAVDVIQGQQLNHVATVVPCIRRDSVLPTEKLAKNVATRITLLVHVGNAKVRGLLASTIIMVHLSKVESTTEETCEARQQLRLQG